MAQTIGGGGGGTIPVGPQIFAQPQSATIGLGTGVRFSVGAKPGALGGSVLRYQWMGPGGPIPGATTAQYEIPAATAAQAGSYSVRVADATGTRVSDVVTLTVLASGWVAVGGRAMADATAPMQPSLALCGQPTVAWISTASTGLGRLYVSRFNGTHWENLGGGVINRSLLASAAEPALDCSDGQPVVAWAEGTGAALGLFVSRWNGTVWQDAGSNVPLNQNIGSTARRPVLRVNDARASSGGLPTHSAIAWIENGQAKVKVWSGVGWQFHVGGSGPGGNGIADLAMALDRDSPDGSSPPVVALVNPVFGGNRVSAWTNRGGWRQVASPPSPVVPASTALRLAGIGVGADRVGRLPVAAWLTGAASLESARLESGDFTSQQLGLLSPAPVWTVYAPGSPLATPRNVSFDPKEFRISCGAERVPTFGLAVASGTRVSVLRGECPPGDSLAWRAVVPVHTVALEALSLRMAAEADPVIAGVEVVGAVHRLTVWRYAR
jgi:hypothetical protein